jgi:UbiD family decarboxylase
MTGDKVNLFQFPIPRINVHDASFYISKPLIVTKDPDSDWVNIGMYRMMVLDRNRTCVGLHTAASHGALHYAKYAKMGQDMPVAVALGTEPILPMVAGSWQPAGWCEYDFAGAIRGEPEELVMAETVKLPVPARAEIVLEGILKHEERALEAPFGEYPGSYSGDFWAQVFEIKAMTYRNNPIYDSLFMGRPIAENHYMTTYSKVAGDLNTTLANRPEITGVAYLPPYAEALVIQGRWGHTGHPREVMLATQWKVVIAVDEDVDPWDANQVLWAISARCRPDIDVLMIPEIPSRLDPAASPHGTLTRMLIDATKSRPPYHRYHAVGYIEPRAETPKWQEKIRKAWGQGGKNG